MGNSYNSGKICSKGTAKISEYLDKQLDLKHKGLAYIDSELERHMEECVACRHEFQEQQQMFAALSGLQQLEPPEDFTALLVAKLSRPAGQQLPNQAMLNERMPNMAMPSRVIPNWVLLLITSVLTTSTGLLLASLYWLTMFTNLSFIKTITDSVIIKALNLTKHFLESLLSIENILVSLVKAFWAFVTAYPLPFITITAVTFFILMILVKLIGSYQRENYA